MIRNLLLRHGRWALLAAMCAALVVSTAAAGGHRHDRCPDCGNAVCVPSIEKVKEKKHCWCIGYEQICIPRIRWPWQSCCEPPKCGRVRNVKVLNKIEYECEACGCKWDIQRVECRQSGACRR